MIKETFQEDLPGAMNRQMPGQIRQQVKNRVSHAKPRITKPRSNLITASAPWEMES